MLPRPDAPYSPSSHFSVFQMPTLARDCNEVPVAKLGVERSFPIEPLVDDEELLGQVDENDSSALEAFHPQAVERVTATEMAVIGMNIEHYGGLFVELMHFLSDDVENRRLPKDDLGQLAIAAPNFDRVDDRHVRPEWIVLPLEIADAH